MPETRATPGRARCVDVHAHYCPPEYFKKLEARKSLPCARPAAGGSWLLRYGKGGSSLIRERMYSLAHRLEEMDSRGVDMQVLSPLLHGVHRLDRKRGLDLCRLVNDGLAEAAERHRGRFAAFAILPLQGIDESLGELERTVATLGFKGVTVFSNIEGRFLDEARFWPVYERIMSLDVPVFIHPTHPVNDKGMQDHGLVSCLGFLYDTTLAMARIIFSGLLERYGNLKWILPHLGSVIPYVSARIDKELGRSAGRVKLERAPSEYFRRVYVDTVSLHRPALMLAHGYLGSERILFGCDYPFWGIGEGLDSVRGLDIPEADKENVFYRNAERLKLC